MKSPYLAVVLSILICMGSHFLCAQLSAAPQPQDHFLGTWKLNKEKSAHTGYAEQQSFTVERQGSKYKFTYVYSDSKGVEHRHWFLTDMKGTWAVIVGLNLPEPVHAYVVRKDSDGFEVFNEFASINEHYSVSADGKTMTVRRQLFVDNEPSEHVFVFDRIR